MVAVELPPDVLFVIFPEGMVTYLVFVAFPTVTVGDFESLAKTFH